MTAQPNVYEVLITYTQSIRLLIAAESPEAAAERAKAGEWSHRDEIDSDASDFAVRDVRLAPGARRRA